MATLVLLYNGLPAAIISIFAAVVVRRHLDVPARVLGRRLRLVDLPAELHFDHRYLHAQDALRELLRGMAWWLCIVPSIMLLTLRLAYCLRGKYSCDRMFDAVVLVGVVVMFVQGVQLDFAYVELIIHSVPWKYSWQYQFISMGLLL